MLSVAGAVLLACLSRQYIGATNDFGFFRCLYGFFLGNLVYAVYRERPRFLKSAGTQGSYTALEVTAIAVIILFVTEAGEGPATMAAPLIFAFGVYVFALEGGAVSKFMSSAPFRLVGALSYSIYMVHFVYFNTLSRVLKIFEAQLGIHFYQRSVGNEEAWLWSMDGYKAATVDLLIFLLLASSIGLAYLTYTFIEKPGRRWLENRLLKR
jgi:peptidoglycan/LPS O-acetylase OafA/YrhL